MMSMMSTEPQPLTNEREDELRAWVASFWPDRFVLIDEDDDIEAISAQVGGDIASCLASLDALREAAAPFATCDGACATCVQAGEPCASNRLHRLLKDAEAEPRPSPACPDCGLWQRPCGCVAIAEARAATDALLKRGRT
jgi:hypothetical protein